MLVPYVGSTYGLKRGRSSGGTNPPIRAPAMPDICGLMTERG